MRVLNVMLGRGLGGVEFAFTRYTRVLGDRGHDVTCCIVPDAALRAHLPPGTATVTLTSRFDRDPFSIWAARGLLRTLQPDVILTHGRRGFTTFAWARMLVSAPVALVNVLHREIFTALDRADRIIAVSADIVAAAAARGIDRAKLMHIPNFAVIPGGEIRPALRQPPVIGFLGRMVPEKGLDLLIAALAELRKSGASFTAVIGGDGPLRASLTAQAEAAGLGGTIAWRGWVEDTAAFFRDIDILAVPSRHESFGLVTIEAFGAGKPVVATRTSGSSEIVVDGRNGLLCDIAVAGLERGLRTLLADPERAIALARQAHQDAQQYTADKIAGKLETCLAEAISLRRGATARAGAAG